MPKSSVVILCSCFARAPLVKAAEGCCPPCQCTIGLLGAWSMDRCFATGTGPVKTHQSALQGAAPRTGGGMRKARTQSGKTGKKQDFKKKGKKE